MKTLLSALCLLLLLLCGSNAFANDAIDAGMKVDEARLVMLKLINSPDSAIPLDIMSHATAIIIIPSMIKGGFIVGASYGSGVVLIRQESGRMGPPVFFNAGGASLGLQIGGQSTDLVLIVASNNGLGRLLKNEMTIGTDMSVSLGPVGRHAKVAVSGASTSADLYSYSSSAGLFAGVSLDGTGLSFDQETTSNYYGRSLSLTEASTSGAATIPQSGEELMQVINRYMGY